MDIVSARLSTSVLLHPDNPALTRLVVQGPVRRTKTSFLAECLKEANNAATVFDIGGGQGGDLNVWLRAAAALTTNGARLCRVDVVDTDPEALNEYDRRLRHKLGGKFLDRWVSQCSVTRLEITLHQGDCLGPYRQRLSPIWPP